jgi:hypothetical protein
VQRACRKRGLQAGQQQIDFDQAPVDAGGGIGAEARQAV